MGGVARDADRGEPLQTAECLGGGFVAFLHANVEQLQPAKWRTLERAQGRGIS